jgi:hypothetical protein
MLAVEVLATTAGCAKEQKEGMDECSANADRGHGPGRAPSRRRRNPTPPVVWPRDLDSARREPG